MEADKQPLRKMFQARAQTRALLGELKNSKKGFITVFVEPSMFPSFVKEFDISVPLALRTTTEDLNQWESCAMLSAFPILIRKKYPLFQFFKYRIVNLNDIRELPSGGIIESQSDTIYSLASIDEVVKYQKLKARG